VATELLHICSQSKKRGVIVERDPSNANAALVTTGDQQSLSSVSADSPGSAWKASQSYTVQQAAALTGLGEHTLRYYERIGLIMPVQRQESSGHRRYGPEDLAKLETLACLRATGMPIDQMRRYFELRSHGADAATEQQALLSEHLKELHRRMAELQTHMKYVQLKIDYWRAVEGHDEQTAAGIAREAEELIHTAVLPLP
jgi:MerR family transcriptional regulator, aldehyde-responsive regulator